MEEEVMKEISLKVEVLIEMFSAMDVSLEELGDTTEHKN
jgi:hypothetical protein